MIDILDMRVSCSMTVSGPQKVTHRSQSTPLTSARLFMSSGKMRLPLSSVMVVSNLRIHRA